MSLLLSSIWNLQHLQLFLLERISHWCPLPLIVQKWNQNILDVSSVFLHWGCCSMQNEPLVIKSFKIWPEEERRKEYDRDKPHCAFKVADPAVPETGAMQFSLFLFLPFTAFEQSIGIISSCVLCCWKAAKQITFLKRHQLCPWITGKNFLGSMSRTEVLPRYFWE